MAALRIIIPALILFSFLLSFSEAKAILVGGRRNLWSNPQSSDSLIQWAEKKRFKIGDYLIFDYDPKTDGVLQVTQEDYDGCNRSNPIKEYNDGKTTFKLDRSGPFFFIGKAEGRCENGQKLIVVVLARHHSRKHSAPKVAPAPAPTPLAPTSQAPAPLALAPMGAPSRGGASGLSGGFLGVLVGIASLLKICLI